VSAVPPPGRFRRAFSLIEVMLALGIVAFCLVTLMGLMTVGLQTSRDSTDTVQAADIASMLVSLRRTSPTNSLPTSFALPPLNLPANGTLYLAADGAVTSSAQASYRLTYGVVTNSSQFSSLQLMLTWPPPADPIAAAQLVKGRYELFTCIPLP